MEKVIKHLKKEAAQKAKENRQFFKKLKRRPPKDLDYTMQELHDAEFSQTDCLQCANCCKTIGPMFTNADIERISKYLKMKSSDFVETYLRVDEDNDHVLQQLPCVFLGFDNQCSIYSVRPKACREFPPSEGLSLEFTS